MADNNEVKADLLIVEAEKKLNTVGNILLGVFGGGSSKTDEAIECYQRAANLYKMAQKWSKAGQAFCKAAALRKKTGETVDAATNYIDAGNCYRKSEPNEAVSCIIKAIEIYIDMGRFHIAAKHHQTIAEIYEVKLADLVQAVQHYEQAADYFKGEASNSSANRCFLKVAHYAAQLENYQKAIQIYEEVASTSLDNSLLKYSATGYFFRAALCHLCIDMLNGLHAVQRYENMSPAFQVSRECKLVKSLIGHMEENDVDGFTETVKGYDSISRLDPWFTTILLRIKKQVAGDLGLC